MVSHHCRAAPRQIADSTGFLEYLCKTGVGDSVDYLSHMRLFCDEMVAGLARWLRAAGHDAVLPEPGEGDRSIVERAAADGRMILTRDQAMAERRLAAGRLIALSGDRLAGWAAQATLKLNIDWLAAPFSRCLGCNLPLERYLPPSPCGAPITCCPGCGKIFWAGSHVRRMEVRLRHWRDGDFR